MEPRNRGVLVREPSPRLNDGLVTHVERVPIDVERAEMQWARYVDTLRTAGWSPRTVAPLPDSPDGVFVEDAVVMFGRLAVLTRPGAAARRIEVDSVATSLTAVDVDIATITGDAHLDGGDVLKVARTVYVGRSGRTDDAGIDRLRQIVEPAGYRVVPVLTTRVLHLKSAVTALPDGTIVGFPDHVDDSSIFPRFVPVPEPEGAHVVVLDDSTVLMSASAPATASLFRHRGLGVVTVEIDEIEKLEGCVTCLSVRLRG
jgi:dimethylargininase